MSETIPYVAGVIWHSVPIMYAILTVLLFIVLRMFSRDEDCETTTNITKNIGKKVNKTTRDIADSFISTKKELTKKDDDVSNQSANNDAESTSICKTSESLDIQAYGELFISSLAAGFLVKYGW